MFQVVRPTFRYRRVILLPRYLISRYLKIPCHRQLRMEASGGRDVQTYRHPHRPALAEAGDATQTHQWLAGHWWALELPSILKQRELPIRAL